LLVTPVGPQGIEINLLNANKINFYVPAEQVVNIISTLVKGFIFVQGISLTRSIAVLHVIALDELFFFGPRLITGGNIHD